MELEFKHLVLLYALLIFLLFFFKPHLFQMGDDGKERQRKFIMLAALFIIVAIITYYIKIYMEYYTS